MEKDIGHGIVAVALALMAGGMAVVGYVVAPTLFAMLERTRAGEVAGQLFTWVALLATACSLIALALDLGWLRAGRPWVRACLVAILVLVAVGHFGLRPQMAALKAAGAVEAMSAEARAAFGRWHGISAVLYLLQSLLALAAVAGWRR
jgi:hypothetical protein